MASVSLQECKKVEKTHMYETNHTPYQNSLLGFTAKRPLLSFPPTPLFHCLIITSLGFSFIFFTRFDFFTVYV